ncbi:hypothetical protein BpHYR1_042104 [Brachionus plicatilis]|uniref:Uncharacterized protein n=1 Tax=Brachionus plicatilis TaxID=10195 RepID=A0A3M7PWP6_BRAPC|nr:hypothetical protein BpHYR1_042104 [Brachionus plicatilis]
MSKHMSFTFRVLDPSCQYEVGEVVKVLFNHYRSQYYFLSTVIEINETPVISLKPKIKRKTRPESLFSISQPEQKNSRALTNPYSSQANVLGSQH